MMVAFSGMRSHAKRLVGFKNKIVRRLVRTNYHLAKTHFHYTLARQERRYEKQPILVYQMAKVGSRSVFESLKSTITDRPIYHFHILRPKSVSTYERWRRKSFPISMDGLPYVWRCQYLYQQITRGIRSNSKKWKVISLVRDPIARNISDFFQNIRLEPKGTDGNMRVVGVGSEVYDVYGFSVNINNNNPEKLIDIFLEKYPHDEPLKWFDLEFKDIFNFDIFAKDFPKSEGYKIYKYKSAEILLMRLENLEECAQDAFKAFLNIENFSLLNRNIGSQKDYANIYQAFKDSIVFPESTLEKIYSSKYARHFYSEEEIKIFKNKWS